MTWDFFVCQNGSDNYNLFLETLGDWTVSLVKMILIIVCQAWVQMGNRPET